MFLPDPDCRTATKRNPVSGLRAGKLSNYLSLFALLVCVLACLTLQFGCRSAGSASNNNQIFRSNSPEPYNSYNSSGGTPDTSISNDAIGSREITEVTLGPQDAVAEIGSQVVLVAGVKDSAGRFRVNEPVQWLIDRCSPGTFVEVPTRSWSDLLLGAYVKPEIENPQQAVTSTIRKQVRLSKGTPTPQDDSIIDRGYTWVVLNSQKEGTSLVSASALNCNDWQRRTRRARIHWVDARATLPPRIIAHPVGAPLPLVTTVFKQSGQAATGCLATYKVLSPPEDGFQTDKGLVQEISVPVDQQGNANVSLVRQSGQTGTTEVAIAVCRTGCDNLFTQSVRIAQTQVQCRWGDGGIRLSKTGPLLSRVGDKLAYRIVAQNTGDQATGPVQITDEYPNAFRYVSSVPVGSPALPISNSDSNVLGTANNRLEWILGNLAPGETATIEVVYQAIAPGSFDLRAYAKAGEIYAEDRTQTRITAGQGSAGVDSGGFDTDQGGVAPLGDSTYSGAPSGYGSGTGSDDEPAPTATPNPEAAPNLPPPPTGSDNSAGTAGTISLPAPPASPNRAATYRGPPIRLDMRLQYPVRVALNQNLDLQIQITNRGLQPIANTRTTASFSAGLTSCFGCGPLYAQSVGIIQPNQMRIVGLQLRAVGPGPQKATIEVETEDGQKFTRNAIIHVEGTGYAPDPNAATPDMGSSYGTGPAAGWGTGDNTGSGGEYRDPYSGSNIGSNIGSNQAETLPSLDGAASGTNSSGEAESLPDLGEGAAGSENGANLYSGAAAGAGAESAESEIPSGELGVQVVCRPQERPGEDFVVNINLTNTTGQTLHGVRVTSFLDPRLRIVQFTENFVREPGQDPYWNLEIVEPNKQYGLMLKLRTDQTDFVAQNKFSVRAAEGNWTEGACKIQFGNVASGGADPLAGVPPIENGWRTEESSGEPSLSPDVPAETPATPALPPGSAPTPASPDSAANSDDLSSDDLSGLPGLPGTPESAPGTASVPDRSEDQVALDVPGVPESSGSAPIVEPLNSPEAPNSTGIGISGTPNGVASSPAAPSSTPSDLPPSDLPTPPVTAPVVTDSTTPEAPSLTIPTPPAAPAPETLGAEQPAAPSAAPPAPTLPAFDSPESAKPDGNFPDSLAVTFTSHRLQWKKNQQFTSTVTIKNDTGDTVSDVSVVFFYPNDSFQAVRVGTKGPSPYKIDRPSGSGIITFNTIPSLENGKSLSFDVRLLPILSGTTEITVEIRGKRRGVADLQTTRKLTIQVP